MCKSIPLPPISELASRLDYDPETGTLLNKDGSVFPWYFNGKGYKKIYWPVRKYLAYHRVCYALHTGDDPHPFEIDHIDRNGLNNTATNLRTVTRSENNRNTCRSRYTFHEMSVGERLVFDDLSKWRSITVQACVIGKRMGWRFKVTVKEKPFIVVYRTE